METEPTDTAAPGLAEAPQRRAPRRRAAAKPAATPDAAAEAGAATAAAEPPAPAATDDAAADSRSATGRLRVKLIRSTIGHRAGARGTVRALGLHRLNETVEVNDTVENRGMLRRIAFLVEVTEPAGTSTDGGGDR